MSSLDLIGLNTCEAEKQAFAPQPRFAAASDLKKHRSSEAKAERTIVG